jgi:hypothetical protein
MPTAVRWFAEHQPFTPIIETVRALLAGGAGLEGAVAAQAVAWCLVIGFAGYAWSRSLYRRERRVWPLLQPQVDDVTAAANRSAARRPQVAVATRRRWRPPARRAGSIRARAVSVCSPARPHPGYD